RTELQEEIAMLTLQTGDARAARTLLSQLVEARQEAHDEMGVMRATLARGCVLLAQGQEAQARADLQPALDYFRAHGLYFNEAQAAMSLAVCDQLAGRETEMVEHLRRALDLAARYDYEYWLQGALARHPTLFAQPEASELLPSDLREQVAAALSAQTPQTLGAQLAAAASPSAAAAFVTANAPSVDLTINMLGAVEIFRDPKRPLAADAWVTKRARDILCFIASRRHRRASKDTIIDTFWADADFDAVEKNFHPTVSHIRKALNSNQALKQNFLLYRDGDYQLNHEFSYFIDIEEFDRLASEGETARRAREQETMVSAFERAVALYRGDFMQGAYDDWVEEQRSYYREQYLRLLETLASAAQKAGEWARSLQLGQQILQADPFREDVHCMLMRAHAAEGNRGAVREQFESLRRLLKKELGVEPASETQKVYREALR
ncbi:MAG TPA: BTAD domain-containing putative transcriptional regulator, partial [Pyrinomonadaceae bacterium]